MRAAESTADRMGRTPLNRLTIGIPAGDFSGVQVGTLAAAGVRYQSNRGDNGWMHRQGVAPSIEER